MGLGKAVSCYSLGLGSKLLQPVLGLLHRLSPTGLFKSCDKVSQPQEPGGLRSCGESSPAFRGTGESQGSSRSCCLSGDLGWK